MKVIVLKYYLCCFVLNIQFTNSSVLQMMPESINQFQFYVHCATIYSGLTDGLIFFNPYLK